MATKAYWRVIALTAAGAIAAVILMRYGNPMYQHTARMIGWAAIIVIIGMRFFFRPRL